MSDIKNLLYDVCYIFNDLSERVIQPGQLDCNALRTLVEFAVFIIVCREVHSDKFKLADEMNFLHPGPNGKSTQAF